MKKVMMLIAALAIAGVTHADLVDGSMTNGFVASVSSLSITFGDDHSNQGWYTGTGTTISWTMAGGTATRDSSVQQYNERGFGQLWTDTLTGTQTLSFDYAVDSSGAGLTIQVFGIDHNDSNYWLIGQGAYFSLELPNNTSGTFGNITKTELLTANLGTSASGSYSVQIDFGSGYDYYAIGFYSDLDGSGGTTSISNVSVSAVPEPATISMLGLGTLISMMVRRIHK